MLLVTYGIVREASRQHLPTASAQGEKRIRHKSGFLIKDLVKSVQGLFRKRS